MSKSNNHYFDRDDVTASAWAISGAAFGIVATLAFSASLTEMAVAGVAGSILGQFLGRWWLKRKPSAPAHEAPSGPKSIGGVSIWAGSCIALGLSLAYFDYGDIASIAQAAAIMTLLIAIALATTMVAKHFAKRKPGQDGRERQGQ